MIRSRCPPDEDLPFERLRRSFGIVAKMDTVFVARWVSGSIVLLRLIQEAWACCAGTLTRSRQHVGGVRAGARYACLLKKDGLASGRAVGGPQVWWLGQAVGSMRRRSACFVGRKRPARGRANEIVMLEPFCIRESRVVIGFRASACMLRTKPNQASHGPVSPRLAGPQNSDMFTHANGRSNAVH